MARVRQVSSKDPAKAAFEAACGVVSAHPIFNALYLWARIVRRSNGSCPEDGWAVVTTNGTIHVHGSRRGEIAEWVYVLAHCLLHLGLGHFSAGRTEKEWNYACDGVVTRFLADLKIGKAPAEFAGATPAGVLREEELFRRFVEEGVPEDWMNYGTAGGRYLDMIHVPVETRWSGSPTPWQRLFGEGLALAVDSAVRRAGGDTAGNVPNTLAQKARSWFINRYPLLGSLAAGFKIIEDQALCHRMEIAVAAVSPELSEIYINPAAGMGEHEMRFVMAHELLHVGLRHVARRQGRDPYLWNVACDYVINGWLVEMGLGSLPKFGGLYDAELKGLSSEGVYDRIVTDLRRYRKLATLRGVGTVDLLDSGNGEWWETRNGADLDAFYRGCMTRGLSFWKEQGRGYLPSGLMEEIDALSQPAMGWDVALARWFDGHFLPLEKVRTYARASRRQSSTPDIPRPRHVLAKGAEDGRTFGVVLDTSGSMSRDVLARALGAIASYAMSREVPWVRVIFCDAVAYDAGYLAPEAIAGSVRVKGRGGTVLQPGVDMLEKAEDFPGDGPILVITDGKCDRVRVVREHAYLMPQGCHLPFVPVGEVFRIK